MLKNHVVTTVCAAIFLAACGGKEAPNEAASSAASGPIKIDRLEPDSTMEAKPFNVQPDGQSALTVVGASIPPGSVVLWNDQPVATSGGGSIGWAAATIPANLYATAGTAKVSVRSPDGNPVSNTLDFTIYGKNGPTPQITALSPESTAPGKGFNVQPGGVSALGIGGSGFLPGAVVFVDGKQMKTVFGGAIVSAEIPKELTARAGSPQVWVVNPDGKASNKMVFRIANQ